LPLPIDALRGNLRSRCQRTRFLKSVSSATWNASPLTIAERGRKVSIPILLFCHHRTSDFGEICNLARTED
jgi:hypothetical protein